MKRILLSVVGGIVIMILLSGLFFLLAGLNLPTRIEWLLADFLMWPIIILSKIFTSPLAEPNSDKMRTPVFLAWLFLHFLSFCILSYAVLWLRDKWKGRKLR